MCSWTTESVRNLWRQLFSKSCRRWWGLCIPPVKSKDNSFFQRGQVFRTHGTSFFAWSSCTESEERLSRKQFCWWLGRFYGCKITYSRTKRAFKFLTAKFRHEKPFRKLRLLLSKKNSLSTSYSRICFWTAAIWLFSPGTESKFWFSCADTRNYSRQTYSKAIELRSTRSSIAKFRNQTWMVGVTFLLCATKLIIIMCRSFALALNDLCENIANQPWFSGW